MRLQLALCLSIAGLSAAFAGTGAPATPAELFDQTRVWTVHLTFTAEQWKAMEPAGGMERGPGGPGRGPGGAGMSPAALLAPAFLKGDVDGDGALTKEEFHNLGANWFAAWSKGSGASLSAGQLRAGLESILPRMQGGPGGPGGPGGFGGPGGPGGPGERSGSGVSGGAGSRGEFGMVGGTGGLGGRDGSGVSGGTGGPGGLGVVGGTGGPGGRSGSGGPGGRGPGMGFAGREGARNGMSGMMGIDFQYVRGDLQFEDQVLSGVAVRYKGNNTFQMARNSIKRSFKIDLNKYNKKLKFAGVTTINLHNNITDSSWMNEPLSYRVFRDAGVPSPRTAYARVYVTVPGKYDKTYFGLYSVVENIDKNFAKKNYGSNDGAIFKPVGHDLFGYLGDDWLRYNQMYDPKTDLTKAQKARVIEFAKFLQSAKDDEFAARAGEFVDLDEFARFMAATVMLSNMDSILGMGQNYYVYLHAETNKFQFLPWDLDHSFGHFPMAGGDGTALSISQPWQGQNRFLQRMFQVPAYQKLYRARIAELNTQLFAKDRIAAQVDATAKAIRAAVAEESETKVQRFDRSVNGAAAAGEDRRDERGFEGGPGFGPGGFGGLSIKAFVAARSQSVGEQLAGKEPAVTSSRRGPGGPEGPGGPGGFSPARMFERSFRTALGVSEDGEVSRQQFVSAFPRWFESWNTDHSGKLTEEQLRVGVERDLAPRMPGGPGFGPPRLPQE